ncbi:hypothetical protein MKX01_004468 [Papaver californicum]|nr:hypothetical protein MKX01_004468 [Papaver californicum]
MRRNQTPCAACKYHKRGCLPECPLAPIFTPNRREDVEAVYRVFTAGNFIKLLKLVKPDEQVLAAESLITEAKARVADPARGLAGTMHNLSHKLDDLRSELGLIKQQNELIRRRHTLQHKHLVSVPSTLLQQLGSFGDFLIPVPSNKKSCGACTYKKKKCPQQCPLATFFPSNREEDFQTVSKVFGAANFIKLIEFAGPKQHLAAETLIIEAIARVSDPVHGLAGIAETLSQQLDELTSELIAVNQQNKHDLQRIIVLQQKLVEEPQKRSISAEGASSPARVVVPSLPLQDLSSFNNSFENDGLSLSFPTGRVVVKPTAALSSVYTNQLRHIQANLKSYKDSIGMVVNSNLCSSGAIFKCSNNADGVNPTAASSSVYTNQLRDTQTKLKSHKDSKGMIVNSNLCSSGAIFKCFNDADDVKPSAASLSLYTNRVRDIQAELKYHMDAKESIVDPNLCSTGANVNCSRYADDVQPTAALSSVYTNQLRDIQAESKYHMDAKESTVVPNLCSGGAIFNCSNNAGDLTKRSLQENKGITGKFTPRIKEEPRII